MDNHHCFSYNANNDCNSHDYKHNVKLSRSFIIYHLIQRTQFLIMKFFSTVICLTSALIGFQRCSFFIGQFIFCFNSRICFFNSDSRTRPSLMVSDSLSDLYSLTRFSSRPSKNCCLHLRNSSSLITIS